MLNGVYSRSVWRDKSKMLPLLQRRSQPKRRQSGGRTWRSSRWTANTIPRSRAATQTATSQRYQKRPTTLPGAAGWCCGAAHRVGQHATWRQQSVSSRVCVQVATWGMFPRPPDISKAYGGGRTLKPGQELESEDDRAARARRVTEVHPAPRAHCQHTPAAAGRRGTRLPAAISIP
jgi:hypothetical protein